MKKAILSISIITLLFCVAYSQSSKNCLLVFSARGTSFGHSKSYTGHAFVTWLTKKGIRDTAFSPLTLGLFPDSGSSLPELLTGTRGIVKEGYVVNAKGVETDQIQVAVDSLTFFATISSAKTFQNKDYSLLQNNCVTFMDAIAKKAGLKTPSRYNFIGLPVLPKVYLRKLLSMNKKSAHRLRRFKLRK